MNSLQTKIRRGGKWMVMNQAINQVIRISASLMTTRILAPEDFGLFVKCLSVVSLADVFISAGLPEAVIQDRNISHRQVSTIFWLSAGMGMILASLFFFLSGTIAAFYQDNAAGTIVKYLSVNFLLISLFRIPLAILRKELKFKEIFIIDLLATLLSSAIVISMALKGYGYYSLIGQQFAIHLISFAGYFITSRWHPAIFFSTNEISGHLSFTRNVLGDNLLSFLTRNIDNVLVGKFQGNLSLGYYSRAYYFMLLPISQVQQLVSGLFFPSFSILQDDIAKIRKIFLELQKLIILLIFPVLLFAFFYIDEFIILLLGEQWIPSIIIFKIFIVLAMVQSFTTLISPVFLALNRPDLPFRISLVTKPLLVLGIYLTSQSGIIQVAALITVLSSVFSLYVYTRGIKLIELNGLWDNLGYHVRSFATVSLLASIFILLTLGKVPNWNGVPAVPLAILAGYYAVIGILNRKELDYYLRREGK